ncbi:pancreatic lipase-related protein 2-like isoform X2 [Sipha flava]|nr:pancreatic lipase-related protein 2-like isoform X2 [Sipha flava]
MIESTTYDLANPMKLIVHGWLGTTQEKEGLCSINIKSYFKVGNYNVICVDWKQYSTDLSYAIAKARAKHIGKDIARVVSRITKNMTEGTADMHLIGHSLGAHIVGFTGKILTNLVPRITGLDPAKPMYEKSDPQDRLDFTDAQYVDIIHTNGDQNALFEALGHIDIYPNGGKSQPNCGKMDKRTGSCSHIKSYHYFAHSIWAKEDYVAQNCSSWDDYKNKKCKNNDTTFMGEHVDKNKTGTYFLETEIED